MQSALGSALTHFSVQIHEYNRGDSVCISLILRNQNHKQKEWREEDKKQKQVLVHFRNPILMSISWVNKMDKVEESCQLSALNNKFLLF